MDHRPDKGNDDVAADLYRGRPLIGVSHAQARFLPAVICTCADAHVTVRSPGRVQIRRLLKVCADGSIPRKLEQAPAAGLTFSEIVASFHAGQNPARIVENLRRAKFAKSLIANDDPTPPLEQLVGLGEAKIWGLALIDQIEAWQRGVAWRQLSTSAVVCGPPGTAKINICARFG